MSGLTNAATTFLATALFPVAGPWAGLIAQVLVSAGTVYLLNAAAAALSSKQRRAESLARELSIPSTAPSWRFVYGEARATGTPVALATRGDYLWGCWLLNSRPSQLDAPVVWLDKREVVSTGDPFDFTSSGGAEASNDPFSDHVKYWIGKGDQTSPPQQFLDDVPWAEDGDEDLWLSTDAWKGRTVMWMRLDAGDNGERQERWPSTPPTVEVEGRWSLVWDPDDEAQDPDDETTWEWSENHSLCVLDALMRNPIRAYRQANIHFPSFSRAAVVSDQVVSTKAGGTEARYVAAGTLTFADGEIEDQINPLVVSGGADLIRIGGKLGLAAGEYRSPSITVSEVYGSSLEAVDLQPSSELSTRLRVSYISPARGYDSADLQPWDIPGAQDDDGGVATDSSIDLSFCPSPTQAMRVRKIAGLRLRRQERVTCLLPPEAFDLVGGAAVTLDFPEPFDVLNGIYEVESLQPALDPLGSSGELAMRIPAVLIKTSSDIFDWDPATEEEDVNDEPYDGTRSGVEPPGTISVITGDAANLDTGGTIIPRIRFAFDPSPSGGVTSYEWRYREAGDVWISGGSIDNDILDGSGQVFGYLIGKAGQEYDIAVRTIASGGESAYREITGVTPTVDIDLDLPTDGSATETSPGIVEVSFKIPNDADVIAVEIFGGDTSDPLDASALADPIYGAQNSTVTLEEAGLGSGVTRYYFARSRGIYASASDFTAAVSVTTA